MSTLPGVMPDHGRIIFSISVQHAKYAVPFVQGCVCIITAPHNELCYCTCTNCIYSSMMHKPVLYIFLSSCNALLQMKLRRSAFVYYYSKSVYENKT